MATLPNPKTPIPRCIQAACYTERMLSKFPQRPALTAAAQLLATARTKLGGATADHAEAELQCVFVRADVAHIDFVADGKVQEAKRRAQSADGIEDDRICQMVFKDGITPIVRPVGETQCDEMRKLEGNLDAAAAIWPDAPAVKGDIEAARKSYEDVLKQRKEAKLLAAHKRAVRDMAKDDLLEMFAKVHGIVKTEFPRNKSMQDMFFMDLSSGGSREGDDEEEEAGTSPTPAPGNAVGGGGAAMP